MRKLLTYLGLLTSLLAIPNISKADDWAYYLIGDINKWSKSGCQTSEYMFGTTSNSTSDITWWKEYTGKQLDPDEDGTAYFKFYVKKNSQYYYYLYNDNGDNNTSVTIGGSTVDVVSNQGAGSFQVSGIDKATNYRIYLQTGTNNDREKGTVRIEAIGTNVTTTSVDLLDWKGATKVLTKDGSGSEWKLSLSKEDVADALNNGDFYFSFIENMSNISKYAVVPNVDQTSLTVNGGYTSDTYATTTTTDEKKDYKWKFTPTGADNYTIYFKNDNGTRSVKVTDDRPKWYLHSNLGGAEHWDGVTDFALSYNAETGYYERTLTQAEVTGVTGVNDVRFRIYDGNYSWGPSNDGTKVGTDLYKWVFDNEGSESYTSTNNSTQNYFSIPNDIFSAKIAAKSVNGVVEVNVTIDDNHYYWVSPQITNGEKWPAFKMVASRNRNLDGGDGNISRKYYTFTIKNDDLVTWKTKSKIADETTIQWYIVREDDGLFFRPETNNDNPKPTEEKTSLSYKNTDAVTYTDDAVGYRNFEKDYHTDVATRKGYFEFKKGYSDTNKSNKALAYTFMINDENGNVFFDYAHKPADTGKEYDLVGNFSNAKGDVKIDLNNKDYRKQMTKYWYKKDVAYKYEVESADSIVYKVEVQKPSNGWGDLYIDVNERGNTSWTTTKVLRPLISLGNNLDGRALHGALTTANSNQSLNPEPSSNYLGYTFSFNATTRTYRLEFHTPDATLKPGTEDGNVDFKGSVSEDIAVALTNGSDGIHTKATQYAIGFGADANFNLIETNKYTDTKFNLSFDGSTNKITYKSVGNNYTGTVSGNSIYVKVRGFDSSGNYGDIHTYKYTFHSKIGFEPHGGLFINSAKIKISGGVPPYKYEIRHYNTKIENGEKVIDYTTGTLRSSGTFSNTSPYDVSDDNFRISTPGFLKIIDKNGDAVSFEEVGGGFDFTYSTSENYKPYYSNTAGGYSTINADDAGAYPNGADYWKAAPGDLSYKLDPTWGGSSSISDESSEVLDWKGEATKHVNNGAGLSQTVTGLNTNGTKTYTVQAIVRGKGEKNKTVTLTLEGADIVTKTVKLRNSLGGKEDDADLSRNGSEVTRTGRVEYIEPMTFSSTGYGYATGDDNYKQAGTGWVKVEAKAKANASGELTIKIKGEDDEYGWFNLSTVTLLEDANTTHGFRTTASATATEVGTGSGKPYDYRARNIQSGWKQNNAYSFFDRGKNRNAVIFANNRTVIAMDKSLLAPECPNRDIDRRHPFNVVGSDEDDSNHGVAKALYLTDMGYGGNVNNPVDYKIGTKGADGFNSPGYKDSGYTFMPIYGFLAENVILDRTPGVSEKEQTTIMLPFSITVDELKQYYGKEHLQVWDYTGFNLDTRKVRLTQVTDNLIANKPYMLTGANGTLDSRNVAAYRNKERIIAPVSYTLHHSSNTTDGGFSGTYEYITVSREDENKTETHYGFRATEGTFTIASESGAKLKPFRAYFTLPISYAKLKEKLGIAESRTFSIVFDADATTGITQTEEVRLAPANVYNINGVLMNSVGNLEGLPKGIYIMNGKKFVVK